MTKSSSPPLFSRGDLNGFWALFADNLANMVIISSVCLFVFQIPRNIVFGRILPGLGIALVVGLVFYAQLARKLAQKTGRDDVTALPYGISTPVLFVYLFGVMLPAYLAGLKAGLKPAQAGTQAWQIAMAAALVGGLLEASGAIIGPYLKRVTPRAGMLGTLAGIALVYIATVPLAEIMEHPLVGFPALIIILIGLIARYRLPAGIPAGLLAILVGVVMAVATGQVKLSTQAFSSLGFYPPLPLFGDLLAGLKLLFVSFPTLLLAVLPIEIYNFIETMNNVESAEAAGDHYPVRTCQLMDGVGTMTGALFGGPFPTTVYIGHPAYKRLGARSGYALAVGIVFFLISVFGLMEVFHQWIPVAAVAPILVFVGITITGQAFQASSAHHAVAVAFALLPHVSDILVKRMGGVLREASGWLSTPSVPALQSKLQALQSEALAPDLLRRFVQNGYIHYEGQLMLSKGAIIVGLLWGSIVALLIDRKNNEAAGFCVAAAVLTLFGIIHVPQGFGIYPKSPLVYSYLVLALCTWGLRFLPQDIVPDTHANETEEPAASEQEKA
ncbi:MAG: xanthine/uracil/vitamin C permease [Myxococcales bacterium]|nr:xanthine/uracil/vitamin C permease [Myxococcales bacterium]